MVQPSFDALYREHYPRVLGICRRLLGAAGDAEDAAQDTFVRGYRAFARYRPEDPFGPWIGAIASNHCIDLLRRRQRLNELFSDADDAADSLPDPTGNGVGPLIEASDAAAVSAAVDRLPDRYRLPILLAYYADASYDDIAANLGITRNHVGVLLLRGRERLRHELAETAICRC
ncbi:MAG: sigma-70 family RNA polymerase sigma factor [Pseudomonadales bacterium]